MQLSTFSVITLPLANFSIVACRQFGVKGIRLSRIAQKLGLRGLRQVRTYDYVHSDNTYYLCISQHSTGISTYTKVQQNNNRKCINVRRKETENFPLIYVAKNFFKHWPGQNGTSRNRDSENRDCTEYRFITLPGVMYGGKTWSLTLTAKYRER